MPLFLVTVGATIAVYYNQFSFILHSSASKGGIISQEIITKLNIIPPSWQFAEKGNLRRHVASSVHSENKPLNCKE